MQKFSLCLIGALALMLSGCGDSAINDLMTGGGGAGGSAVAAKPKPFIVSDMAFEDEVSAVDRGYTARLGRRTGGEIPTSQRKDRTMARVSDEIVATVVAVLRQNGLDAQPGAAESLKAGESALVVAGTLRSSDPKPKRDSVGFGPGRGGVAADITLTAMGGGSRKQLLAFTTDADGKMKLAPATSAAIKGITAAAGPSGEALSGDVEGPARAIGRNAGERIVAFAKEQGWVPEPAVVEAPVKPTRTAARKPVAARPVSGVPTIAAPEPDGDAEPAPKN